MTVVADTHSWIWWVFEGPELSRRARSELEAADVVLVPAICLWEAAMLVARARIPVSGRAGEVLAAALVPGRIEVAEITLAIAARSVEIEGMHGDPADRLIAATALELGLPLITRDRRLTAIPALQTVW